MSSKLKRKLAEHGAIAFCIIASFILLRNLKYKTRAVFIRCMGPLYFRKVGSRIRVSGPFRVDKPFSDIKLGDDVFIGKGCYFLATENGAIEIGNNVNINDHCYITSNFSVQIGDGCLIGEFVSIRDYDHEFSRVDQPIALQGFKGGPISIGEGCWIGRGVMVTSGVTIGRGCIIGANAVVTRDLPDWSIAVGVPARVIRKREMTEFQYKPEC